MTETYGWGDTAVCAAMCAVNCVFSCGVSLPKAAVGVGVSEASSYQAP